MKIWRVTGNDVADGLLAFVFSVVVLMLLMATIWASSNDKEQEGETRKYRWVEHSEITDEEYSTITGEKLKEMDHIEVHRIPTLYYGDIELRFTSGCALRHFQARLMSDEEFSSVFFWSSTLISKEECMEMGEDKFNEFLYMVMEGAEKRPYPSKKKGR